MHLPVAHSTSKCCLSAIKLPEFSASSKALLSRPLLSSWATVASCSAWQRSSCRVECLCLCLVNLRVAVAGAGTPRALLFSLPSTWAPIKCKMCRQPERQTVLSPEHPYHTQLSLHPGPSAFRLSYELNMQVPFRDHQLHLQLGVGRGVLELKLWPVRVIKVNYIFHGSHQFFFCSSSFLCADFFSFYYYLFMPRPWSLPIFPLY